MSYKPTPFPWPIFFIAMLPIFLWEDDPDPVRDFDTQKLASMSAEDAETAVDTGMKPNLAPYFAACQAENEITPGISEGVTIEQANAVIDCMEDAHSSGAEGADIELDWPSEGEKWNALLRASMSAPTFSFAYDLGIVSENMGAHFEACQSANAITAGDSRGVTFEQIEDTHDCLKARVQPS